MFKSSFLWIGIIAVGLIPVLLIDIGVHRQNWKSDVREELISTVQGDFNYNRNEKAKILDRVFAENDSLMMKIYSKAFGSVILLAAGIMLFKKARRRKKIQVWKIAGLSLLSIAFFTTSKLLLGNSLPPGDSIKLLPYADNSTLKEIHNSYFRDKVVYVDFWGTGCGPCLEEFRNFYPGLKEKYKGKDLSYLYISVGNKYLWTKQLERYRLNGSHLFLKGDQYEALYRQSLNNDTAPVFMPRYMVLDKSGNLVITDARRPSEANSLYEQLDTYLAR